MSDRTRSADYEPLDSATVALTDLILRLRGADQTFTKMIEQESTNGRLIGKRQGVRLALRYAEEALGGDIPHIGKTERLETT